jgi:hypothetical protein
MNDDAGYVPDNYKGYFSLNSVNNIKKENLIGNKEYMLKKIEINSNYFPGSSCFKSIVIPAHTNL